MRTEKDFKYIVVVEAIVQIYPIAMIIYGVTRLNISNLNIPGGGK
jgi:hypothetical protein